MARIESTLVLQKFFVFFVGAVVTIILFESKLGGVNLNRIPRNLIFEEYPTCGRYPLPADVTVDNVIWQVLQIRKGFVKVLNAYAVKRPFLNDTQTFIKLNVASVQLNSSDALYCQFWYENSVEPVVVNVTSIFCTWGKQI
jgi:hypothetical protein